jgi:hypothetical protein
MSDSENYDWTLGKRACLSCEGKSFDIEDGLCRGCRGESSYNPEMVRAATPKILSWKSAATRQAEAEAERHLAESATARRLWRGNRYDRRTS